MLKQIIEWSCNFNSTGRFCSRFSSIPHVAVLNGLLFIVSKSVGVYEVQQTLADLIQGQGRMVLEGFILVSNDSL